MSIISSLTTQSGLFSALYGSSSTSSTDDSTLASLKSAAAATTSAATDSSVTISQTAAEKADNAKDFATLAKEVRATLDTQYTAAQKTGVEDPTPDLSGMTGRALAAIALNKDDQFSASEVAAARSKLRDETRSSFSSAIGQGTYGRTAIAAYSQQLVDSYDSMSSEERQARGWGEGFRTANEAVVTNAGSSLFDAIDDD